MMLSANGHIPTPLMFPFCASDKLNFTCNSPMMFARTPKMNDVATSAMKHAQKSFMCDGAEGSAEVE